VGRILTNAPLPDLRAMYTYDGGESFYAGKIDQPLQLTSSAATTATSDTVKAPVSEADSESNAGLLRLATTYLDRSTAEMSRGAERESTDWFYAAALASPPGGSWVERYQWVPGLRRPVPILRFAVGLQYSGPRQSQLEQAASARGRRGAGSANVSWKQATGEIGESIVDMIASHLEQNAENSLLELAIAPPPTRGARGARNARTARPATRTSVLLRTSPGESLAPGVTFLGAADESVLRAGARRAGIEVLVLVDWRDLGHKQSVRLELIDTARDVSIFQLPWIESSAIGEAQAKLLADNPFPQFLSQLAEFIEEQLSPQPLPEQIQPRHVAGRLATLSATKPENPLATLAEMRFYRERGLADDTQLLMAFQSLIGAKPGIELSLGDAAARERVLKPSLPVIPPQTTSPRVVASDDE
jgi:hypothetical protein